MAKPTDTSGWSGRYAAASAKQLRRIRDDRKMSAQQLSDACAALGHPIHRSVLANFENGRRYNLAVTDLLAIARVLDVPPFALLFPVDDDGLIEVAPGERVPADTALAWSAGRPDPEDAKQLAAGLAEALAAVDHVRKALAAFSVGIDATTIGAARPRQSSGPDVLTVEELAERERVSADAVRTWIAEGEAPRHYTVGKRTHRFRLADVEAWERSRESDPGLDAKYGDWDFDDAAGVL